VATNTLQPDSADILRVPFRETQLLPIDLDLSRRPDGTIILGTRIPMENYVSNIPALLADQAQRLGDKPYLARRGGTDRAWRFHSFQQTKRDADAVTQWLLNNVAPGRTVLILSGNSVAHAVVTYGGYAARTPVCAISVNYAALGGDFGRLKHVVSLTKPAVIFAEDASSCAAALKTLDWGGAIVVTATPEACPVSCVSYADILATPVTHQVADSIAKITPDEPTGYMLTSGSTGMPKAVIITQRMLASNVAQCNQAVGKSAGWHERLVDWLPWSHAAGAFGLRAVMIYGGTLYIDDGRPIPGLFDETIRNLREISVSYWGNVPLAYAMLADALERDDVLRETFFKDMRLLLYGGAGLPQHVHDRIQAMAIKTTGRRILMTSGYGATEASSSFMVIHYETDKVGVGLPVPGATVKLVPLGDRYEVRVAGPMVTPGYLNREDTKSEIFDDEGYYKLGDLAQFHDANDLGQGMYFAGRLAEEFKLSNGAWVYGGQVRADVLKALAPLALDLIVCGDNEPAPAIMAWPNSDAVRAALNARAETPMSDLLVTDAFKALVAEKLRAHNLTHTTQSTRIHRCIFLADLPTANSHEMSDKGTVNRRIVMQRRADVVARLYAAEPDAGVIVVK